MAVPKRYSFFIFGIIQAGFTCAIATGIATAPNFRADVFIGQWFESWAVAWLVAWATMIPFVLLATPVIRRAVDALTAET